MLQLEDYILKAMVQSKGNALSEYGLVGSLIVLVCIAAFLTVGGNLKTIFSDMKGDMQAKSQVAVTANANARAAAIANVVDGQTILDLSQLTEQEQDLLKKSLAAKLQTTGANGATKILASQLELLAKKLLESGEITALQSDSLLKLASQGYRLAKIESLVEDAVVLSGGDPQKLKNMQFNLDGQSYTAEQLGLMLGFDLYKPVDFATKDVLEDYSSRAQPEMQVLLELFKESEATGLMQNEKVRATVESATTQIATIAESVEDLVWESINMNDPIENSSDFNEKVASFTTRMNAAKICNVATEEGGLLCSE